MTARAKPRRREWTPPVASSYAEYAPSDVLRPFVECFWTREAERTQTVASQPGVQRVLPDGCMDVILSFPEWDAAPESAMAVGTMTRALVLDASVAPQCYVGVRFRPARAAAFLSLPASEITDLRVSLDELWPDAAEVGEALADGLECSRTSEGVRPCTDDAAISERGGGQSAGCGRGGPTDRRGGRKLGAHAAGSVVRRQPAASGAAVRAAGRRLAQGVRARRAVGASRRARPRGGAG